MTTQYMVLLLVLISGMVFSIITKRLTVFAAVTGAVTGLLVFIGAGFTGLAMMTVFFILGSFATSFKINAKKAAGLAEGNKGKRTTEQVIANAGFAGILGLLAWRFPALAIFFSTMMAASFSSATADTLSSELGNIYGKRFYNIISLKPDQKGLDGVVSIEGTLFGLAGSLIIAIIFSVGFGWKSFVAVFVSGTIGNLADSFLGATLERKGVLANNAVNFLNTAVAAMTAGLIYFFSN